MSEQLTPLPVRTTKRLALFFSGVALLGMLYSLPETDRQGRAHVFTPLQQYVKHASEALFSVDEKDAAAIRALRDKASR